MFRLIHISDLHVAKVAGWKRKVGWKRILAGDLQVVLGIDPGHDTDVARDLGHLFETNGWFGPRDDLRAVVSGDLSMRGTGDQLAASHRLIDSQWDVEGLFGLRAGDRPALTQPGNHDFWRGSKRPKVSRDSLGTSFWMLPWVEVLSDKDANLEIHIVGVDSCSGFGAGLIDSLEFVFHGNVEPAQLERASRLLQARHQLATQRGRRVLRVAMMHHAPRKGVMQNADLVTEWLADEQVSVTLFGHSHCASGTAVEAEGSKDNTWAVRYFDAGSTLQLKRPKRRNRGLVHYNTFIEHIISAASPESDVSWEPFLWVHRGTQRGWSREAVGNGGGSFAQEQVRLVGA